MQVDEIEWIIAAIGQEKQRVTYVAPLPCLKTGMPIFERRYADKGRQ